LDPQGPAIKDFNSKNASLKLLIKNLTIVKRKLVFPEAVHFRIAVDQVNQLKNGKRF